MGCGRQRSPRWQRSPAKFVAQPPQVDSARVVTQNDVDAEGAGTGPVPPLQGEAAVTGRVKPAWREQCDACSVSAAIAFDAQSGRACAHFRRLAQPLSDRQYDSYATCARTLLGLHRSLHASTHARDHQTQLREDAWPGNGPWLATAVQPAFAVAGASPARRASSPSYWPERPSSRLR
jgi:hypothetical protein